MKPLKILIATHNPGKLREIHALLNPVDEPPIEVCSLNDLNITDHCPETGRTFLENAREKSMFYSEMAPDLLTVAEDSGLAVETLGGNPGIHSARFAGPDATSRENIRKLLEDMESRSDRKAAFMAVAVLARQGKMMESFEGRVEGLILKERDGEGGFGYDPVFFYPPANRTFARLTVEEKNRVSHRAQVFGKLRVYLKKLFF